MTKMTLMIGLFFSLTSFIPSGNMNTENITGNYSGGDASNPAVSLTINADKSYTYVDKSDVNNQIKVEGQWSIDGQKITLEHDASLSFHDSWKLDSEYPCLKSRSGLAFYRLCKQ